MRKLEDRCSSQWPEININDERFLNFCSNDYLGMSSNQRVLDRVSRELKTFGFGSAGAALLTGRCTLHSELEVKLADYTGHESALLFSSGYLANLGAICSLVSKEDWVFHDRLNHASLIDAVLMTGSRHRRYPHLLVPSNPAPMGKKSFLITESVFSMDGDKICLNSLSNYCIENNSTLYIDDAHGFGVLGEGQGVAYELKRLSGECPEILIMITLGKALGSSGGVVLGPKRIIDFLTQNSRPFIYDTAPPPVVAAAALEALSILQESRGALTKKLQGNINFFRKAAKGACLPITQSTSPIQPILIGDAKVALGVERALKKLKIYARAIRPPTVPKGTSRLRVTLSSQHTEAQILDLINALKEVLANGYKATS